MSSLRELAIPTSNTNSYNLCEFLTHLCNTLQPFSNIILYNIEVAYLNKETLNNNVDQQLKFFQHEFEQQQEVAIVQGNPLPLETIENFQTKLKEIEANLSNCGLVTNATWFYKASKCNYFLVASAPNYYWLRSQVFKNLATRAQLLDILQKHQEHYANWHAYAIYITNRKVRNITT